MEKINAIVATRMTSSRLPGKVSLDLAGKPVVVRLAERLQRSRYLHDIVIATTRNEQDDIVVRMAQDTGVSFYRGSEEDVLQRTVEAAEQFDTEYIVQVTSDCPLVDAETLDRVIERMLDHPYLDYVGNQLFRTYPLGCNVEIFRTRLLREIEKNAHDSPCREHVTLYIYEHQEQYRLSNVEAPLFLRHPEYRLTLDTVQDYQLIKTIFEELYPCKPDFNLYDAIRYLQKNPQLLMMNAHVVQKTARPASSY